MTELQTDSGFSVLAYPVATRPRYLAFLVALQAALLQAPLLWPAWSRCKQRSYSEGDEGASKSGVLDRQALAQSRKNGRAGRQPGAGVFADLHIDRFGQLDRSAGRENGTAATFGDRVVKV